jgi:cysteine desulfurase/selenocysteine lyase
MSPNGPDDGVDLAAQTRGDFPLLARTLDGRPITHLDSASTAPKPQCVIDAVLRFYRECTANVHRGVHVLSEEATALYEQARHEIASFLNASPAEIVITRNATEGVNLVAQGLDLQPDEEVVVTALEHHSNLLPWRKRGRAVAVALREDGTPRYEEIVQKFSRNTRLVALAHVSNTLGVVAPVEEWVTKAHRHGVPVLVDASQSASHVPIDVRRLDCDFLVFSGHKLLGPSGAGVLYGKRGRLEELGLYQVGGGMVQRLFEDDFTPQPVPWRFEAGTPNIEGMIGLGAAVAYLRGLGMDRVQRHSHALGVQLVEGLRRLKGVRILGDSAPLAHRIGLVTFVVPVPGLGPDAVARMLCDRHQILVSGGYHCAHLLHDRLQLAGTVRASTQVFNSAADIDRLLAALKELLE